MLMDTASGRLFFAAGLVGDGQPVDNVLTVDGTSADVCNLDVADVTVRAAESTLSRQRQRMIFAK